MLFIDTFVGQSAIHGLGLFANHNIEKGTIIGEFNFGLDISLSYEQYKDLSKSAKVFFDSYGWKDQLTKKYMLNIDNTRFINHSDTPNIKHQEYKLIAANDIKKGEELLDNYNDFDDQLASKNLK